MVTLLGVRPVEPVRPDGLNGLLAIPPDPSGIVIFAHGSGSGRLSPRNNHVADALHAAGMATLLLDLLTPEEEQDRVNVFDIALLASRLVGAADWVRGLPSTSMLPIGYFGASTGAGAALLAASGPDPRIRAIVSRGGRPDLAGARALARVQAPTMLIVGSRDVPVIALNETAMAHLRCEHELVIVPGAHHLFEEAGTLDTVIGHATRWFAMHFQEA
ncbi:dienelactone hydrolase family protein [Sphingomonas sp. H39-1-10]|uniref:dienelactone hydrolase family protein n=1 Tax=Sphingomonas TaxID=13687 RepID=UPI00087DFA5F|nr:MULTISPECIES: dienelactone hydrolase family protein [Sphingomonas]MDF0489302.1 dienelactone hydrolase family protein [Sphingomonas pollutisoli]SDA30238.1 Dienelactone hydrolase [Sphingomonas sp. NFR15]